MLVQIQTSHAPKSPAEGHVGSEADEWASPTNPPAATQHARDPRHSTMEGPWERGVAAPATEAGSRAIRRIVPRLLTNRRSRKRAAESSRAVAPRVRAHSPRLVTGEGRLRRDQGAGDARSAICCSAMSPKPPSRAPRPAAATLAAMALGAGVLRLS